MIGLVTLWLYSEEVYCLNNVYVYRYYYICVIVSFQQLVDVCIQLICAQNTLHEFCSCCVFSQKWLASDNLSWWTKWTSRAMETTAQYNTNCDYWVLKFRKCNASFMSPVNYVLQWTRTIIIITITNLEGTSHKAQMTTARVPSWSDYRF